MKWLQWRFGDMGGPLYDCGNMMLSTSLLDASLEYVRPLTGDHAVSVSS
jgi:hypothetical protein